MKKLCFPVVLVFFFSINTYSQFIHKIKADSVLITNDSCNAELNLENSTKNVNGFLYNKGYGRTEFRKGLIKINDTLYIIGKDTLNIAKGSSHLSESFIKNQSALPQTANGWISGRFYITDTTFVNHANIAKGLEINKSYPDVIGVNIANRNTTGGAAAITFSDGTTNVLSSIQHSRNTNILTITGGPNGGGTESLRLTSWSGKMTFYSALLAGEIALFNASNKETRLFGATTINGTFTDPAGGSGYKSLNLIPAYNQSGTATGNVYGVYYNPTLTSVLGTHYAWYNTKGNVYWGDPGNGRKFMRYYEDYSTNGEALLIGTFGTGSTSPQFIGVRVNPTHVNSGSITAFKADLPTMTYSNGTNTGLLVTGSASATAAYRGIDVNLSSTGNLNNKISYGGIYNLSADLNTLYGSHITVTRSGTSAATSNLYGYYADVTIPAATLGTGSAYAFYGNAGMNYFSGNVGIGTLPTNTYSLDINSSTNASARVQTVNGALQLIKTNAQSASVIQSWARNTGNPFLIEYQNANTNYTSVPNIGTLNGFNIGMGVFVSTGLITGQGNGLATLVFDDQTEAVNPNSLILILDNSKRPMTWRKDGTTTISTDGLMGHYVAGMDMAGTRLKLSGGRSTGTGAGGSIEFYSTSAGVSGNTLNSETLRMTLSASGNLGIGNSTPTARLHIAAGSSSAGMAPIKLTAGTNLSSPENGSVEYDGTNYFVTSGSARYTLAKTLTATATLDFASTAAQSASDLTVTLTGVSDGDAVSLGVPNAAVNNNSSYSAWISAANTVTIRFNNYSSGAIDPANGTFRISIIKY